jgi:hypothetical protein
VAAKRKSKVYGQTMLRGAGRYLNMLSKLHRGGVMIRRGS